MNLPLPDLRKKEKRMNLEGEVGEEQVMQEAMLFWCARE